MELDVQPFDVRECIEDGLDVVAAHAQAKGLDLSYRLDPAVPRVLVSDVTRVRQILVNLLSNAVKFTQVGDVAVTVSAIQAANEPCEIRFAVEDTGIGIPPIASTGCFSRSVRSMPPPPASSAAPAWAWRSAGDWQNCLGDGSGWKASRDRARGSCSPSRPSPAIGTNWRRHGRVPVACRKARNRSSSAAVC
jgi:hypothetical protein